MAKRIKYGKSRIDNEKKCWFCDREVNDYFPLDHHEFLNGPDKPHAVADGLWVWACRMCHTKYQNDIQTMLEGKKLSQKIYEVEIGDRESFMQRYRRNYL